MKSDDYLSLWLFDDDREDGEVLGGVLNELYPHISYRYYETAESLFAALQTQRPRYLLFDSHMPVHGMDCLKKIRERDERLCLISYSGSMHKVHIEECYAKGTDLYVVKPSIFQNVKKSVIQIIDGDWKDGSHQHQYLHEGEYHSLVS